MDQVINECWGYKPPAALKSLLGTWEATGRLLAIIIRIGTEFGLPRVQGNTGEGMPVRRGQQLGRREALPDTGSSALSVKHDEYLEAQKVGITGRSLGVTCFDAAIPQQPSEASETSRCALRSCLAAHPSMTLHMENGLSEVCPPEQANEYGLKQPLKQTRSPSNWIRVQPSCLWPQCTGCVSSRVDQLGVMENERTRELVQRSASSEAGGRA